MGFFHLIALLPFTLFHAYAAAIPEPPTQLSGIYLTSQTVANKDGDFLTTEFAKLGGNMIVFDLQTSGGRLAYPSNIPLSIELGNRHTQIPDLAGVIKKLHDKDYYVVARYVLFKNGFLAGKKPAWTLKRKGTKSTFVSRDGPIWLDPGNQELKEYITDVCREVILAGVDEIQFDYVRFPEGGKGGYAGYSFTGDDQFTRDKVLTNAVAEFAAGIHFFGIKASVDVFGIVVWDNVSWKIIGQNIADLAKYVDAIYPMPYPSHFGRGWGGHKNPADEPYFFVQETTKKFLEQTKGGRAKIRPWLQGFTMNVSKFGPDYIKEQIRALSDIEIYEYSVWNASNVYTVTFNALK